MPKTVEYRCAHCHSLRTASNHWLVFKAVQGDETDYRRIPRFEIMTWREYDIAKQDNVSIDEKVDYICSQQCASAIFNRWLSAQHMLNPPSGNNQTLAVDYPTFNMEKTLV